MVTVHRSILAALLVVTLGARPQLTDTLMTAPAADSLGRFPRVEGRNLEGESFALPSDFKGDLNVVLVAFKRQQQSDVDSWTPFLRTITAARGDVRVYEVPTLGRGYRLMRSFIDGGMRGGIPDKNVRAATITVYIGKVPFRRALNIADEDRIHVFLVDREGRVHWRADGPFGVRSGAELERRLDQLPPKGPKAVVG